MTEEQQQQPEGEPAEQPQQLTFKSFTLPQHGEAIQFRDVTYFIGDEIGHGVFGVVYECGDSWGNKLAAKVLLPRKQSYDIIAKNWEHESQYLQAFRNPFITYLHAAFEYKDSFYLVTERCESTISDLFTLDNYNGYFWLKPIARCLLQAVHFLHAAGVVHKDIHLGNVFTSVVRDEVLPEQYNAMRFKLGDFGISNIIGDVNVFNTLLAEWMLPPEHLNPTEFGTIDHRLDIYHCGLLFLAIIHGREPQFTKQQVLDGVPRQIAEGLLFPYNVALSKALRRHVAYRTASAMELWRDLNTEIQDGANKTLEASIAGAPQPQS